MTTATERPPAGAPVYDPVSEALTARLFTVAAAVQEWADRRKGRVRACALALTHGVYELTVIGAAPSFDFSLNAELAELTTGLVRAGLSVSGLLLPGSASEPLFATGRFIRITPA